MCDGQGVPGRGATGPPGRAAWLAALVVLWTLAGGTLAAPAAAAGSHAADAPAASGSDRWVGQRLAFEGAHPDRVYELRRAEPVDGGLGPGALVRHFRVDGTGAATVPTAGLEPGAYVLVGPAGDVVRTGADGAEAGTVPSGDAAGVREAALELARQRLGASFADGTLTSDRTTTLALDSDREGYAVELTAEGLSPDELAAVFGGTPTEEGVRLTVADGRLPANFSAVERGHYLVEVDAVDGTASARARVQVGRTPPPDAFLDRDTVAVARGDVARLRVHLRGTDEATLVVGSEAARYETRVRVVDRDGDGEVVVEMNTYLAGGHEARDEDAAWAAAGPDTVTSTQRQYRRLEAPLFPDDYDLGVRVGDRERATGTLSILRRSTDGVTTATAPGGEFRAPLERLRITPTETVAVGDVLVVRIDATGLGGLLEHQPGDTTTAQFRDLIDTAEVDFTLVQQNPKSTVSSNRRLFFDPFVTAGKGGLRVVHNREAGALFVLLDEPNTRFRGYRPEAAPGDRFEARFTLSGETALAESEETVAATVTLTERSVTFDAGGGGDGRGDGVTLRPVGDAPVSGTATAAPGTGLDLRLRAGNDTRTTRAYVTRERTFDTLVDAAGLSPGTEFRIGARGLDGGAAGVVGPEPTPTPAATPGTPTPTPRPTASPTPTTTPAPGTTQTPTEGVSANGLPGLGVPPAVLAVLALAVLARRTR